MFTRKHDVPQVVSRPGSKETRDFCQRMIESCQRRQMAGSPTPTPILKKKLQQPLEHYGLNSSSVDRLRNDNVHFWVQKRMSDIDQDTEQSREYVRRHQHVEDELQKKQFVGRMKAHLLKENMDDKVQAHLIKMEPTRWFSGLISELPRRDDRSSDILRRYKRQAESRIQGDH